MVIGRLREQTPLNHFSQDPGSYRFVLPEEPKVKDWDGFKYLDFRDRKRGSRSGLSQDFDGGCSRVFSQIPDYLSDLIEALCSCGAFARARAEKCVLRDVVAAELWGVLVRGFRH